MQTLGSRPQLIWIRRNKLDGEGYAVEDIEDGLFCCPLCFHTYKNSCSACGAPKPSAKEVADQWGPLELLGTNTTPHMN